MGGLSRRCGSALPDRHCRMEWGGGFMSPSSRFMLPSPKNKNIAPATTRSATAAKIRVLFLAMDGSFCDKTILRLTISNADRTTWLPLSSEASRDIRSTTEPVGCLMHSKSRIEWQREEVYIRRVRYAGLNSVQSRSPAGLTPSRDWANISVLTCMRRKYDVIFHCDRMTLLGSGYETRAGPGLAFAELTPQRRP
jgi:hypothetical protein